MKKTLSTLLLILFTVGLLVSCNADAIEELFQKDNPPVSTTYTVTFDIQGHGEQITSYSNVVSGATVSAPPAPTADGFVFEGWYKDSEFLNEWKFNTDTVTSDTTLYAKWSMTVGYFIKENFPQKENAWKNASSCLCYYDPLGAGLCPSLRFEKTGSSNIPVVYLTSKITEESDKYVYLDNNNHFSVTFNIEGNTLSSIEFAAETSASDDVKDLVGTYKEGGCLAAGTMITMADGTKQAVETLLLGDMIKTFDHETGEISSAPIYSMWAIENCFGNFTLHFADNISVSVVQEHCFFDRDTNRYEVITYKNASEYIGHHFYNADADKWEELINVAYSDKPVTAYYIFTAKHFNHIAEGMLSLDPLDDASFTYVFDFGENLKFDEDKKLADIQKYGLMTMEEMPFVSKDYFEALNMQYLKIAYGRGLAEKEKIEKMIHYYMAL